MSVTLSTPVAEFTDKYGETKIIHRDKNGLRVKRECKTPILRFNQAISRQVGAKVKARRIACGMTLEQLATKCGITSGHPKNRMWEIENALRGQGMRMGTLFALAWALDCEVGDLLPSVADALANSEIEPKAVCLLEAK